MSTFQSAGITFQHSDSFDVDDLLVTGFTFLDAPDHTIPALVLKETKDRVQALNVSSSPISSDANDLPYKVKQSPLGGKGIFSSRALKVGELILTERPIIVTRAQFPSDRASIESLLQILHGRLPPAHQKAYSALSNSQPPLETGPLLGRLQTNGFTFYPYPSSSHEACPPHAGVFPTLSRVNHSCGPNAYARFNYETFAIELRVTRPIKDGEEIMISYTDVLDEAIKRRVTLMTVYSFVCQCKWCVLPKGKQQESNARRKAIAQFSGGQINHDTSIQISQEGHADVIKTSLTHIVDATREGLEPFTKNDALTLSKIYSSLGDEKQFKKWKGHWRDLTLATEGPSKEVKRASEEIEEPSKNDFWRVWVTEEVDRMDES